MSLYGGLAENLRRNERVDRGVVSVTGSLTINLAPGTNDATHLFLGNDQRAKMRQITHFELTIDDGGAVLSGIVGASTAVVTGSLNAAGTVLTIHCNSFTSVAVPTLIASTTPTNVRYTIWGNLSAGQGF